MCLNSLNNEVNDWENEKTPSWQMDNILDGKAIWSNFDKLEKKNISLLGKLIRKIHRNYLKGRNYTVSRKQTRKNEYPW